MTIRLRYVYATGNSLGYSIERLDDGLGYDFADSSFKEAPTTAIAPLTEGSGIYVGRYAASLDLDTSTNGSILVTYHDANNGNHVVGDAQYGQAIEDAVSEIQVEDGISLAQSIALVLAANAGKITTSNGTVTIRDVGNTVNRITANTDASGNRTNVGISVPG